MAGSQDDNSVPVSAAIVGPKAQPFSQPWATPRGKRRRDFPVGPTGQLFSGANGWPVGPFIQNACLRPLGVAQGWENRCPLGQPGGAAGDWISHNPVGLLGPPLLQQHGHPASNCLSHPRHISRRYFSSILLTTALGWFSRNFSLLSLPSERGFRRCGLCPCHSSSGT